MSGGDEGRPRYLAVLAGVAGLAVFVLAVAVVLGEEIGFDVTDRLVEAAGNDYVVFAAFGAVALLLVFVVAASRALFGQDQAEPPEPERVQTAPHPGAGFDRVVDEGLGLRTQLVGDDGASVRDRLRRSAVEVVMRTEGVPREVARDRVESGSWTENDAAAAFLAAGDDHSRSLGSRLLTALSGRSRFQRGATAAADEIARLAGVDATTGAASERGASRRSPAGGEPGRDGGDGEAGRDDRDGDDRDGGDGGERDRERDRKPPKSVRQAAAADGGRRADGTADTVGSTGEGDAS